MSAILTSHIFETIEPESCLYQQMNQRAIDIPKYEFFGPCDMCYLVKELKGGLLSSKSQKAGFFHHVYGVDCSSSASVAAYLKSLISKQETNSKVRIIKGIFCMYDAINK